MATRRELLAVHHHLLNLEKPDLCTNTIFKGGGWSEKHSWMHESGMRKYLNRRENGATKAGVDLKIREH